MEELTKRKFSKMCRDNQYDIEDDTIEYFWKEFKKLDNGEEKKKVQIMLECSRENIERIFELLDNEAIQFYENYDSLMLSEGWSALSFICDTEINENLFQAMYDQGVLDDDRIYNCIAVNHTVFHPGDSYSEPYVVWFS